MTCGQYAESAAGRILVVTSSTRPTGTARYVGQRIFESDTGRELLYDGVGWLVMYEPAQTWTVTTAGVTGGSVTSTGSRYYRSRGICRVETRLSFGGSPSAVLNPTIQPPYPVAFLATNQLSFAMYDNAGLVYLGIAGGRAAGSSDVSVYAVEAGGARATSAGITASSPFSVGSGDVWELTGAYRVASASAYS